MPKKCENSFLHNIRLILLTVCGMQIKRCFDIKRSALEIAEFLVDCRIEIGYNIISDN